MEQTHTFKRLLTGKLSDMKKRKVGHLETIEHKYLVEKTACVVGKRCDTIHRLSYEKRVRQFLD
jgi:hypothetical protein